MGVVAVDPRENGGRRVKKTSALIKLRLNGHAVDNSS